MSLDFSYVGCKYGEMAHPEIETLTAQGYKVYDVTDPKYGAIPNDGKSDRAAFMKVLEEIASEIKQEDLNMTDRYTKENAEAIIYFPERNYILQDEDSKDHRIRISMSDTTLKGIGGNKTIFEMTVANSSSKPTEEMRNAPVMMEFKHSTGLKESIGAITEDASIGSRIITVSLTGVGAGSWVYLVLESTDDNTINFELYPHKWGDIRIQQSGTPSVKTGGIQIYEYHQIEKINGNNAILKESIMHAINKDWGWRVHKFVNYANVGVEDLTFEGHAKEKFIHHSSGIDDGGSKLIGFVCPINPQMRRASFGSVGEAMSITSSANCPAHDITIGGNRGYVSIRSQASSRIFVGRVTENSSGYILREGKGESTLMEYKTNVRQYHACGISKQSMDAVIWNARWGDDSRSELHAIQPRATLIDCCSGGFVHRRQGGDSAQIPNYTENLIIQNFSATNIQTDPDIDIEGGFTRWDGNGFWWKFMPPITVGFHGNLEFDATQMKRVESVGNLVEPYSLYEAQLRKHLGHVPSWLSSLK